MLLAVAIVLSIAVCFVFDVLVAVCLISVFVVCCAY